MLNISGKFYKFQCRKATLNSNFLIYITNKVEKRRTKDKMNYINNKTKKIIRLII